MAYHSKYSGAEVDSLLDKIKADDVGSIDSSLSTTSDNPVQNKVITEELNKKANKTDIATINGQPLTNGGNIEVVTDSYDDTEIKGKLTELAGKVDEKQDTLIAGDNIKIEGNVISSTGGGGGSADLSNYVDKTSEQTITAVKTFSGGINMANTRIQKVQNPSENTDAVNKQYVDDNIIPKIDISITNYDLFYSPHIDDVLTSLSYEGKDEDIIYPNYYNLVNIIRKRKGNPVICPYIESEGYPDVTLYIQDEDNGTIELDFYSYQFGKIICSNFYLQYSELEGEDGSIVDTIWTLMSVKNGTLDIPSTNTKIANLETKNTELTNAVASLETKNTSLETRIAELENIISQITIKEE